jgi:phosphoesterase RecJ-like protein
MNSTELTQVKDLLARPERVVIVTHRSPDGDAIGSSLGLYNILLRKGHTVTVIVPNDFPPFLKWMPGAEKIVVFEKDTEAAKKLVAGAELIFCLDFNNLSRIDKLGDEVRQARAVKFLIDHHPMPEDFADFKFHFPAACSTAQLIYEFIAMTGDEDLVDADSGICLYTGIMTDTASFRFPSVSPETHQIAAKLIQKGVQHYRAHEQVYDSNTYERLQLLGYALGEKLKVVSGYHTAYLTLTRAELDRFGHRPGDTEGLVNYGLSISGTRLSAFFMEREGTIKVSLRSKGSVDVNALARKHFNGGGHKNAAGGEFRDGGMEQAIQKLIAVLPEYKNELTAT